MIQRDESPGPAPAPREQGLIERGFWFAVDRLAPRWLTDILHEVRDVGFFEFLKRRISRGLDRIFSGMQAQGGVIARLASLFQRLLDRGRIILDALVAGDCQPLFAAVREFRDTLSQMAGDAWSALTDFLRPVGDYLANLWDRFGAPVVDFLRQFAGDVWDFLSDLGRRFWDATAPIRDAFADGWSRIKDFLGFNSPTEDDGSGGITGWISEQAGRAWDQIKLTFEPVIAPIRIVVEKVRAILPLDAILNLRDTVSQWMDHATQMADTMDREEAIAEDQDLIRSVVLPGIRRAISSVRQRVSSTLAWVNSGIGSLVQSVQGFFTTLESTPVLRPLAGAIHWLSAEAAQLGDWASETVGRVFGLADRALVALNAWIEPVLNALQRLIQTLSNLMDRLADFVLGPFMLIPRCIREPIKDFLVQQILGRIPIFSQLIALPDLWARAQSVFRRIVVQVFRDGNLLGAAWTFFREIIQLFGLPPQLVTNLIRNAARAIRDILADPVAFLLNLKNAAVQGFVQFLDHIGTHLLNGLANWLFGALSETGIRVPREFSLRAVFDVVLQVLDLTQARIFAAIERRVGPERTAQIRRGLGIALEAFNLIRILVEQGPAGLWSELQSRLSNLWDTVIDGVREFVIGRIVAAASRWILSLLDVTGITPVINAIVAVYNAVQSFFRYLRQLLEILNSVFEGLGEIARGVITRAANLVESNLARLLPIALGFLANQVGLGDLPRHLARIVGGVRRRVDQALDWIVDRIVRGIQAVGGAVRSAVASIRDWFSARKRFVGADGQNHSVYLQSAAGRYEPFVASDPERVGVKARQLLNDPASTPDQKTRAQEILTLESSIRQTSDRIVAEGAAGRGDTPATQALVTQINTDLQTLADRFVVLFATGGLASLPTPEFSFTMDGGRAKSAEARFLSANRPAGSQPAASPLGWDEIVAQGLTTRGQRFVQMHLLNERLGGLGVASNLVPGATANNRNHHNSVERPIKNLVGDNPRESAAITRRKVLFYRLDVTYRPAGQLPFGRDYRSVAGRPRPRIEHYASQIDCSWSEYTENTTAPATAPAATRWQGPGSPQSASIPIDAPQFELEP
jgi:phage-related protein